MDDPQDIPESTSPFRTLAEQHRAGLLGMKLLLASLATLFAATLGGLLFLRLTSTSWPTGLPSLPRGLWVSTAVLLLSAWTMHRALAAARGGDAGALRTAAVVTLGLGVLFLALQAMCWEAWMRASGDLWSASPTHRFALTGFYVLTGTHALHAVGGFVPLAVVIARAGGRRYTGGNSAGVQYAAMYWHFLGVVWLVLLAALLGTS